MYTYIANFTLQEALTEHYAGVSTYGQWHVLTFLLNTII